MRNNFGTRLVNNSINNDTHSQILEAQEKNTTLLIMQFRQTHIQLSKVDDCAH